MDTLAFEHHLASPQGLNRFPAGGHQITADGGSCCDTLRFSVSIDGERVSDAGFEAHGCGATTAAGSAAVTLARGRHILEAAKVGADQIAAELGGLSPGKLHAAELAADALARALGSAVRACGRLRPQAAARSLVAMSGGVDSAVAALLCSRQDGNPPVAVTLELWSDPENDAEQSCCSSSAVSQARAVAHDLGMPHFTIDLREQFRAGVVEPFIEGYAGGETPNPCVACNGNVRLDAMLELAERLGCSTLATGHYARRAEAEHPDGPLLRTAADPAKDQSYMLVALDPKSLARMRFPLGELTKPQVRELAAQANLTVASKKESQDLCFLAGSTRARFLARHGRLGEESGPVLDAAGRQIGTHRGQHHFTVGQRRGLPVATGVPLYVLDKHEQRVTVGPRESLRTTRVALRDVHLRRDADRVERVKLRYRQQPIGARLAEPDVLELEQPADRPAPGQIACLLDGDLVVGWGTIARR